MWILFKPIYPAFIIVLVALNKLHIERGVSYHNLQFIPTPNIAAGIRTFNTTFSNENTSPGGLRSQSQVLSIQAPDVPNVMDDTDVTSCVHDGEEQINRIV